MPPLTPLAWYGASWVYNDPVPQTFDSDDTPDADNTPAVQPFRFGVETPPRSGSGIVFGRFLPPHRGHQFLFDFATAYAGDLTIFLRIGPDDPIPGDLRTAWIRELAPTAKVVPIRAEQPMPGVRSRAFWVGKLREHVPNPRWYFGSEKGDADFARYLGAEAISVDPDRLIVPIRSTSIRRNPLSAWAYLPSCVRRYYLRRVSIIGPESVGKTTLAQHLASTYKTHCVGDALAEYLTARGPGGRIEPADLQGAARRQLANVAAAERLADRILFFDTDLLLLRQWSFRLFHDAPRWLDTAVDEEKPDLTLVLDTDLPYTGDPALADESGRAALLRAVLAELDNRRRRFEVIRGDPKNRTLQARVLIDRLLAEKRST